MIERQKFPLAIISLFLSGLLQAYEPPLFPYSPAADEEGSDAIHYQDASIKDWVTAVVEVVFGDEVTDDGNWKDPQSVIGPASGTTESNLLVLGRGGHAILEFASGIADGEGFDFVVFENAFSKTFLELAYVEVSSDGQHFVRFPNYSLTLDPVGTWGHVSTTLVNGFAGKYQAGYGVPFDLSVLSDAYQGVLNGYDDFSSDFENQLVENYPFLDLQSIRFIRISDVIGDGTCFDSEGFPVYDPYPTFLTAGFDLDAVGVINNGLPEKVSFTQWAGKYQLSGNPEDDSDGDKWKDLLEYYFNTDPSSDQDKPGFQIESHDSGVEFIIRYLTSATAQGQLDLYYSVAGTEWDLLLEGPNGPPDVSTLIWLEGDPYLGISVAIPDAEGEGLFRFAAGLPE